MKEIDDIACKIADRRSASEAKCGEKKMVSGTDADNRSSESEPGICHDRSKLL